MQTEPFELMLTLREKIEKIKKKTFMQLQYFFLVADIELLI
jgi:hypothetical protein